MTTLRAPDRTTATATLPTRSIGGKTVFDANGVALEGRRYFVGQANRVCLAAWGDKHSPSAPGKFDYLQVFDVLPALARIPIAAQEVLIEFAADAGSNLMAAISVPGLAGGKVGLKADDFASGRVTLVKIAPTVATDLINALNASAKIIDKLFDLGAGARVVVAVLIAVETGLQRRFAADAADRGAMIVDSHLVPANHACGLDCENAINVAPGTVIAYRLAAPVWNATRDKTRNRIKELRDDP